LSTPTHTRVTQTVSHQIKLSANANYKE